MTWRAAALAAPILAPDLLTRQRGVAARAEIDRRQLTIGDVGVVELAEEPLGPLVELGIAGDSLVIPGPHGAHALHLIAHAFDVGIGPLDRMGVVLDGRVLGGQAKGVEARREEDVEAVHAPPACACIAGRERVPVAGVQIARRIGQHGQRVPLGPVRILDRVVQTLIHPGLLPLGLDLLMIVFVSHDGLLKRTLVTGRGRHRSVPLRPVSVQGDGSDKTKDAKRVVCKPT